MRITRFSVVLLLTIGLLLLSHTAEAGGAEGGASSSKSSGSKFNFLSRFRKTSQPPPLPEDNVLNRLRHIIPEEEFRQLEGLYQEGFQKNYFDNFGRPSNADGIRSREETTHIAEWHKRLDVYLELAIKDMPK